MGATTQRRAWIEAHHEVSIVRWKAPVTRLGLSCHRRPCGRSPEYPVCPLGYAIATICKDALSASSTWLPSAMVSDLVSLCSETPVFPVFSKVSVTPTGFEHTANSSGNQGVMPQGGAESGALSGNSAPIDPDLAHIINRWPGLPAAIRAGITAMVKAAGVEE